MSYTIYKTPAIIMRVVPHGEASRDVVLLTQDLGKIIARAQSARKMESKMRMHIARYNQVVVDVVHGKVIWRLTGIAQLESTVLFQDEKFLHAFHRAIGLAEHLIRGEEPHPELFHFFKNLLEHKNQVKDNGEGLEIFAVIKVLDHLGYWSGEKFPEIPNSEMLQAIIAHKKELVVLINESLEATQLVV